MSHHLRHLGALAMTTIACRTAGCLQQVLIVANLDGSSKPAFCALQPDQGCHVSIQRPIGADQFASAVRSKEAALNA